jgi:hypothetical protein
VVAIGLAALGVAFYMSGAAPPPEPKPAVTPEEPPPVRPTHRNVRLEVQPPGAVLKVDGKTVAAGTDLSMAPGTYEITATLEGYHPHEGKLVVSEDTKAVPPIVLEAMPVTPDAGASAPTNRSRKSKRKKRRDSKPAHPDDLEDPGFLGTKGERR